MNSSEQELEYKARIKSLYKPVMYGQYMLLNGSAIIKFQEDGFETVGFPLC